MSVPKQQKLDQIKEVHAFAAKQPGHTVEAFTFKPKPLGDAEVLIKVTHCGMCHTDLHKMGNEWKDVGGGNTNYPVVPGHEVIGVVVDIGKDVKNFKLGQRVGFGAQRGSCSTCEYCDRGDENLCDKFDSLYDPDTGGYAEYVRANARFAFPIPDEIDSAHAAPLLCAGVTVFSPLIAFAPKPKGSVAVAGVGGLGHLALQFASEMGYKVSAISTSPSKFDEAKEFGATHFVNAKDGDDMKKNRRSMDLILVCSSADLNWEVYLDLLKPDGKLCILGVSEKNLSIPPFSVVMGRKTVCGSCVGGVKDMNDMFSFVAKHKVQAKIEVVKVKMTDVDKVNEAIKTIEANAARYRLVLEYDN